VGILVSYPCRATDPEGGIGKSRKNFSPETEKNRVASLAPRLKAVTGFRSLAHLWISSPAKFDTLRE
jgi:hypothetical protein